MGHQFIPRTRKTQAKQAVLFTPTSHNQHGVPVTEKAVLSLNGLLISIHNQGATRESTDQHQECGTGKMEIGQ